MINIEQAEIKKIYEEHIQHKQVQASAYEIKDEATVIAEFDYQPKQAINHFDEDIDFI